MVYTIGTPCVDPVPGGVDPVRTPETVFCSADEILDGELRRLHALLLQGERSAQVEIDRRLFACAAAEGGWKRHPVWGHIPLSWLYTDPRDTIQYLRLPDLARFLARGITRQQWTGSSFEMVYYNSLPFLKKGRLFADPLQGAGGGELTACAHVLQASLFGLYGSCAKFPVFATRLGVAVLVRRLVTAAGGELREFLSRVPNLLKLSFVEYVVNVIRDFCPSEISHYMTREALDNCHVVCTNTCDSFRSEMLQTPISSWEVLDAKAGVLVERLARTCKMRCPRQMPSAPPGARQLISSWRKNGDPCIRRRLLEQALATRVSSLPNALREVVTDAGHEECGASRAGMLQALQGNVQCYPLPGNLVRAFAPHVGESTPGRLLAASRLHACLACLNRMHGGPFSQRLRLDVETGNLNCAACKLDMPMVHIQLLGRLLRIGETYYYFCHRCFRVVQWEGDGTEFSGGGCRHGSEKRASAPSTCPPAVTVEKHSEPTRDHFAVLRRNNRTSFWTTSGGSKDGRVTCLVCSRAGANYMVHTPHVPHRGFVTLALCYRHRLPDHLTPYVHDTASLMGMLEVRRQGSTTRNCYR